MPTGNPQESSETVSNKFVGKGDAQTTNPNVGVQQEDAADAAVLGARSTDTHVSGDIGQRILLPGHGYIDRPYAGDYKGRFETRPEDQADNFLRKQASVDEADTVRKREAKYNQHGNVGFSGNYPVGWEAER